MNGFQSRLRTHLSFCCAVELGISEFCVSQCSDDIQKSFSFKSLYNPSREGLKFHLKLQIIFHNTKRCALSVVFLHNVFELVSFCGVSSFLRQASKFSGALLCLFHFISARHFALGS